ncbi:putative PurR-regulated permease PerM [Leifsonia sp. AK011]|uniref:AI-2E family transporter n=1 Tax=Leifsonia sp. AK011 TaxID=2723075 RepID=UPI0015C989B2|nr:AI-2E family transporter [Leifsonia sp. AK011]NYF09010.1 putative PurR-regulated permease PerM [Leifsonia sp. AK011]
MTFFKRDSASTPKPEGEPATPLATLLTDRIGKLALRSGQFILILALASIVVFALVQLKLVVVPLLLAIIIASAAAPLLMWMRSKGLPPIAASWIALVSGIVVFGGIVTLIVFAVRGQWDALVASTSDGIDQVQDFLTNGPLPIDAKQIEDARLAITDFLTSSQFGSGAIAGVTVAGEILTGAVLTVVILFFFMKDGDRIWAFFLKPLSAPRRARGERIGKTAVTTLGGYVRGTAIIALVDSVGIGVGLAILGVPLALPLAVIVFIGAFIPLVGATAAGVLAALVALVANGPVIALIVIIIVIAVNQLEGNFLQPVVMAQSLSLHPLVILVALTAGTILGGIIGAVLSVPIAAVTWAIVKVWNAPSTSIAEPRPRQKRSRA